MSREPFGKLRAGSATEAISRMGGRDGIANARHDSEGVGDGFTSFAMTHGGRCEPPIDLEPARRKVLDDVSRM